MFLKINKLLLITCFGVIFSSSMLFGAGFHVNVEQGMKAMSLGGAFVGLADDPTAIYYNPAGLTQLEKKFNIAGTYAFGQFAPTIHSPEVYDSYGVLRASDLSKDQDKRWSQIPSTYISYKVADKVTLGFAVFAPFGTATDWTSSWVGRYFSDKIDLKTYNFNPTIAYKLNDKLSFGFGINYVYSDVEIKKSFSYPFLALNPSVQKTLGFTPSDSSKMSLYNRLYDRNYDVDIKLSGDTDSSGRGWGYNIGFLFKPNNDWQIGAIYRSEVNLDFEGKATYKYMPGIATLPSEVSIAQLGYPLFQPSEITASIKLPDYAALGIVNKSFKDWTFLFDFYWTGWSDYKELSVSYDKFPYSSTIPKKWDDVIALRLGIQYEVNQNLAFRVGYMYDQSPTNDETRAPELACSDRNDVTFGVGYKLGNFNIDGAFLIAFFKNEDSNLVDEQTKTAFKGEWDTMAYVLGVTLSYGF